MCSVSWATSTLRLLDREPELDEDTVKALAEWLPQPAGFRTVMLCCTKCGYLSKMVIDHETTADEVAGWAMTHEECNK